MSAWKAVIFGDVDSSPLSQESALFPFVLKSEVRVPEDLYFDYTNDMKLRQEPVVVLRIEMLWNHAPA